MNVFKQNWALLPRRPNMTTCSRFTISAVLPNIQSSTTELVKWPQNTKRAERGGEECQNAGGIT